MAEIHTLPNAAGRIAAGPEPVAPAIRLQACTKCGGHHWMPGAGRWVCTGCGEVGGAMAVAVPPADERRARLNRIAARLSGGPGPEAA
jgi:hypothetical protein